MKYSAQCTHLQIYRATEQKTTGKRHLNAQKAVDIALSVVSIAGLISAMAFLAALM